MMAGARLLAVGAILLAALLSETPFGNAVAIGIAIGLVLIGLLYLIKSRKSGEVMHG